MRNKALQPVTLAVGITIATLLVCYILRPELLGPRIAFSALGANAPTANIFTLGFVLAGICIIWDGLQTSPTFQKVCRFVAAAGFVGLGAFRIEHGEPLGNLHRISGLVMMLAVMTSMLGHLLQEYTKLSKQRRVLYVTFVLAGLVSVVMSVLSSAQFKVMALQGLAQYIGIGSMIGWALLDSSASVPTNARKK